MGLVKSSFRMDYSGVINKLGGLNKDVRQTVAKIAAGVTNECISNSPVDTGYLRSQWNMQQVADALWRVSNNTSYIMYLEFGTSRSHAHAGFVRGSISRWRSKGLGMIKAAIK